MPNPQYRLGRQPNDPTRRRLVLDHYQIATPTPPASADWVSGVKAWPMLGNDTVGDCTAAGAAHVAQAVNWYGRNQDAPVSLSDTMAMYEAISGYHPGQPSTDVGATLQDALDYWRKTGVGGNTIAAFAQIDHTNLALVRDCIALYGSVYAGLNVPSSAMDQTNAGKPWTVVARSPIDGGHCVPLGAYDTTSFTCITWGQTQKMDVAFYQRYFDECWVPVDLDWITAAGYSPAHLDTTALNADFLALTGQNGPFPITPSPTPRPAPTPAPAATADQTMAAAARAWLTAKAL